MSATRAPLILPLNGKQHELYPLDLLDLGVVANKMGAKAIHAALEAVKSVDDLAVKSLVLDGAFNYAATVKVMGHEMAKYMSSVEGLICVLTLSISKGDPSFTEEEALSVLHDADSRLAFVKAISSMLPVSDTASSSDPKTPTEPQS